MVHVTSAAQSLSKNVIHTKPLSHSAEEALRYGMFYFSTFNLAEENGCGGYLSLEASPWFPAGSIVKLKSGTSEKPKQTTNQKKQSIKQNCHPKILYRHPWRNNPCEEKEEVLLPWVGCDKKRNLLLFVNKGTNGFRSVHAAIAAISSIEQFPKKREEQKSTQCLSALLASVALPALFFFKFYLYMPILNRPLSFFSTS